MIKMKYAHQIALAVLLGMALYAIVYFMAARSEAFVFIEQQIRNSQAIKAQVGKIKDVRPNVLGPYESKFVDSNEWVSMTVVVTGSVRTVKLDAKASKTNGVWVLETVFDPPVLKK